MSEDNIKKIVLLMHEELELLKALKDTLEKQKTQIFGSKVDSFSDTVQLEDDLLNRIKVVDQERILFMNNLSLLYGEESQLTLTKLEKYVDGDYKISISNIKDQFISLIEDIRQLNLENRFLVKKSMVFVQKNLNVLKDFTKNDYVYSMNGGYGNVYTPANRMMDRSM